MHPGALAARRADAEARIERAAASLAEQAGIELDEERASARDASVSDLYRLEYVAGLLERLAAPQEAGQGPGTVLPPPHVSGPSLLDGTVNQIVVAVGMVMDVDALTQMLEDEQSGRARKGAIAAIEERIAELSVPRFGDQGAE